jgi:type II secretory pathway pseudopilin PulG
MNAQRSYRDRQDGYTIIETVVALGVFSLMLLIVGGLFSQFILTQRRDIGERILQEQIRFALELFTREARTAYASTFWVSGTGDQITFRNQNGMCVKFRVQSGAWQRSEVGGSGDCESLIYSSFDAITSNRIRVTNLQFGIPDNITSGGVLQEQGFVRVSIQAQTVQHAVPPLHLQSSVTSRQVTPYP